MQEINIDTLLQSNPQIPFSFHQMSQEFPLEQKDLVTSNMLHLDVTYL